MASKALEGRTPLLLAVQRAEQNWDWDNSYAGVLDILIHPEAERTVIHGTPSQYPWLTYKRENVVVRSARPPRNQKERGEIVRLLLESGAEVDARHKDKIRAHTLRDDDWYPDVSDETALIAAARLGLTNCARELLEHGADVNAQSSIGLSPLMYAAASGHTDLVELFLDSGADVNIRDNKGYSPLLYAALRLTERSAQGIDNEGSIVLEEIDFNESDVGLRTASRSAGKGSTEIDQMLLDHGADVNVTNDWGYQRLDVRSLKGILGPCRILFVKGR